MKTGFYDLDNIIKLNSPQLIVCSSADHVIETFFTNVLKNITVDQKAPALYIDNNLKRDCVESIKIEREILFENKKQEMETLPMLMEVTDNTLDDVVSNITMLNRYKLMDNRIIESILSQGEIKLLSKNNKIELIDIINGEKYIKTCELFNQEEKEKIQEADKILESAPLFLEHVEKISLDNFVDLCCRYKINNNIKNIFLNNINTIEGSNDIEILSTLEFFSKYLNITIVIGYELIMQDSILLESKLESIEKKCKYIDTILFLKEGTEEEPNILNIWIVKNKNNTLGKVSLIYLEEYKKCINIENNKNIVYKPKKMEAIEDINLKFFNGIMSSSWYNDIELWFSKYGFDEQVMISLFNYCYERCAMHPKYIQEVAKEWAENNIKTSKDLELYIQKKEEENG